MRIFIQTALSLTEFHVLFVLLLLNRINLYLLPTEETDITKLPDLQN